MNQTIYERQYLDKEIFSESWRLFKENFQLILILILIIYVPINVILLFIPIKQNTWQDIVILILGSLIELIAVMAITYAVKLKIDGNSVDFRKALKKSLSRWFSAVYTTLLGGIYLIGLFLLLIIPGVVYGVYWVFAIYVVVLCDKSGKPALDYSKSVVKGRWWEAFKYLLLFDILYLGIGKIITILPLYKKFLINIIINTFADIVVLFSVVVFTVLFINLDATKPKEVESHKDFFEPNKK